MEQFTRILYQIVQDEGPAIFQEPYRFWAIAEDYAGGSSSNELELLLQFAKQNLLPTLGEAYQAKHNSEKERLVHAVEQRIERTSRFSEEMVEQFLQCFCEAYRWEIELASVRRKRQARERAEAERQAEAERILAEQRARAEQQARERQQEQERIERDRRRKQRNQYLKWGGVVVVIVALVYFIGANWPFRPGPVDSSVDQSAAVTQSETETESPAESESAQQETDTEALSSLPGVDPSNQADYSNCLNPDRYHRVESSDGRFSFYYPDSFFSSVDQIGDNYTFYTEDGSATLSVRKESASFSDPVSTVRAAHDGKRADVDLSDETNRVDLVSEEIKDGWAHALLSGKVMGNPSRSEYYIVVSDGDVQYTLDFVYDEDDPAVRSQQWYLVDCLYRLCEHSGTTYQVRSYELFLKDDMGEKR